MKTVRQGNVHVVHVDGCYNQQKSILRTTIIPKVEITTGNSNLHARVTQYFVNCLCLFHA